MAVPQQKFREIVFQMLYSFDIGHAEAEDMISMLMEELSVPRGTVKKAQEKVQSVLDKKETIDNLIAKTSRSYEFERIQSVERNILRLGVFELLFDDTIPSKVAIAEAVRLARKFGSPESSTFVNAVLDSVYKADQGMVIDKDFIETTFESMVENEESTKKAIEKITE